MTVGKATCPEELAPERSMVRTTVHAQLSTVGFVLAWYVASCGLILLNKELLSSEAVNPHELTVWQLGSTVVYGGAGLAATGKFSRVPPMRYLLGLGALRIVTMICQALSLAHCAASFVETVKSSAPAVTVAFAAVVLQERPTSSVLCTLVPITGGLIMACGTELSFDRVGLIAVLSTNILECLQNVCSKYALRESTIEPTTLQFYTSVAAAGLNLPLLLRGGLVPSSWALALDGLLFHFQSVTAFIIMDRLGPTSVSVLNSVKRLVIILVTLWWFQNPLTIGSMVGSAAVFVGAFLYNLAARDKLRLGSAVELARTVRKTCFPRGALVLFVLLFAGCFGALEMSSEYMRGSEWLRSWSDKVAEVGTVELGDTDA
jgi:solute carrier family 35 protein E2